jgi:hypothetical protein
MSTIFVLRTPEDGKRMLAHVKMLAGPAAAAGRPLVAEIGEYDAKGSNEQLKFLFGFVLMEIAEQVEVCGKRFAKEAWYAHYLDLFAPKQDGPRGLVPIGVSQMKKRQRAEFITQIQAHAAQEYGVEFAEV